MPLPGDFDTTMYQGHPIPPLNMETKFGTNEKFYITCGIEEMSLLYRLLCDYERWWDHAPQEVKYPNNMGKENRKKLRARNRWITNVKDKLWYALSEFWEKYPEWTPLLPVEGERLPEDRILNEFMKTNFVKFDQLVEAIADKIERRTANG